MLNIQHSFRARRKQKTLTIALALLATLSNITLANALSPQIVEGFKTQLADQICAGEHGWLTCYQIDPKRCHEVSNKLAAECVNSILAPRADSLRDENGASILAQDIYNCLKTNFKRDYAINKISNQVCSGVE
jgi:hypothetical protein